MFAAKINGLASAYRNLPRVIKISVWLISLYLLYALLLGAITPMVVRAVAPEKLSQLLGRQVSLPQVSINPFLLRLRLDKLAIAGKNGDKPLLRLEHAEAQVNFWQSLFNRAWCVDHLTLAGLHSQIVRQRDSDGHAGFNFDDVIAKLQTGAADTPPPAANPDPTLPDVRVGAFTLTNSGLTFSDSTVAAAPVQLAYHDITIQLTNFATRATAATEASAPAIKPNQYRLSLTGRDNSTFATRGRLLLAPLDVSGSLALKQLTLMPFWPYVAPLIDAQLTDGALSIASQYQLRQSPSDSLFYRLNNSQVHLNNVQFSADDKPVVKLPQLAVSDIQLNSDGQKVNIGAIAIDDLWLSSRFDQHGLSLANLFIPKAATATDTHTAAATPAINSTAASNGDEQGSATDTAWQLALAKLQLNNADINLREQQLTQGVDWRVFPLNIQLGAVDSNLSAPVTYQIGLDISQPKGGNSPTSTTSKVSAGGHLSSQGQLDIAAQHVSGELAVTDLMLSQLQPYLRQYLNITLPTGQVNTEGQFSADAAGHAQYQGNLAVNDLEVKDSKQHLPLLKWQALSIDKIDFDLAKQQLLLGNINLDKPFAKVTIYPDQSTNIGELLVTHSAESEAPKPSTATNTADSHNAASDKAQFKVNVASIHINDGSAFFADNSLTPNFATGIEQLNGRISSISSVPGTKASVDIAGKIDRYAPMSLKGEINPLLAQPYLDLELLFKSVELTSVNPYSGTYAGYYIDKGQLTLALNYQLENNHLNGNNHVVIDQLKLGKATDSPLATSLPVTLAIALLQDRHGVIDLGLPVSGDLDNPDFSIGGIVWKAFTNVITKAVTAPFSFLAGLVSSDEELNIVAFDAGSAKLTGDEKDKLQKLAKALVDRPKLALSIKGSVNASQDSQALAEAKLQWQLQQQSGLEAMPTDFSASHIPASGKLTDALLSLYQQQFNIDPASQKVKAQQAATDSQGNVDQATLMTLWHIGLYNQLLKAQAVSDSELARLAQLRSQAVKAYLVDNAAVAPERVFLLDSKTKLDKTGTTAKLSLEAN